MFEQIPLIDDHVHPWLIAEASADEPFARFFTEATYPEPNTIFYRHSLVELATLLGCAPTEADVVAARQRNDFVGLLIGDANVETLLVDDGYPREQATALPAMAAAGAVQVHRILRIERLAEDLIPSHRRLGDFHTALLTQLEAARPNLVALKSIVAYRMGLDIQPPDAEAAAHALDLVPNGRLTARPLLEYVFHVAAGWAAEHGLPLQIHTGFGDRDLDLRMANPLHLRPLLESGAIGHGPIVLLHASYPYVREAAYLSSVYPNLYVDVSQATPVLAGPGLIRVLEELLALAPVTRLLYGSDAWGIPDWIWLSAKATRRALAAALQWLPAVEAEHIATQILHDNAMHVYRLGTLAGAATAPAITPAS